MKRMKILSALLALLASTSVASAAVVSSTATTLLSSSQNDVGSAVIDLTAGSATAGGTSVTTFALGDGTIEEYKFVNASGISDASAGTLNVLTSSGASISTPTFPAATLAGNKSNVELTLPDGTTVFTANTGANASDASGTIDVSGYNSGTVYFIFGTSADFAQVALEGQISGFLGTADSGAAFDTSGTPFDFSGTTVGGNGTGIAAFGFDNVADGFADTSLDYRAINTDLDGSRARFYGFVLDGVTAVPEPSSVALLGLVGAVGAFRRRRK